MKREPLLLLHRYLYVLLQPSRNGLLQGMYLLHPQGQGHLQAEVVCPQQRPPIHILGDLRTQQ